ARRSGRAHRRRLARRARLAGQRALAHRADDPSRRRGRAGVDRRTGPAGARELNVAGALDGLRVLEVGGPVAAPYASKLLADLGADVGKIEPPEGAPPRRRGPFPGHRPDPGTSGPLSHLNTPPPRTVLHLH